MVKLLSLVVIVFKLQLTVQFSAKIRGFPPVLERTTARHHNIHTLLPKESAHAVTSGNLFKLCTRWKEKQNNSLTSGYSKCRMICVFSFSGKVMGTAAAEGWLAHRHISWRGFLKRGVAIAAAKRKKKGRTLLISFKGSDEESIKYKQPGISLSELLPPVQAGSQVLANRENEVRKVCEHRRRQQVLKVSL